ncbi:hypothetical protein Tco_0199311 [Tanacetum coccineum]
MDSTQASSSNPSKKIILTIIPPRQLFVNISSDEDITITPSPITASSFPSLPNAPSKNSSTKDTSSTFGTTSSLFESKPQASPPTSCDIPSPQPSNPFLENVMDAPPKPSHPLPLQSHSYLDISLSLSPITPLDHILDTPSPPSPQPPPQPPLMGHPVYFNYHDYHGKMSGTVNRGASTVVGVFAHVLFGGMKEASAFVVGTITYRLELSQELSRIHHTFHVSNLKKCHVDEPLVIPLDGLHIDDKLYFIEENIEIRSQKVEAKLYPKLSRFVVTLGKELSIPGNMKTNSGRNIRIFSPNPYFHLVSQLEP